VLASPLVALVLLGASPPGPPAPDAAFAPLVSVNLHLQQSMDAWMAGAPDPAAPWVIEGALDELRANLAEHGVVRLEVGGYEFEPYLVGPKGEGTLRATVVPQGDGVAFMDMMFRTREDGWGRPSRLRPLSDWTGPAADFGEAARRLSKRLTSKKCGAIPLMDPSGWADTPMYEDAVRGLEKTKEELPKSCAAIAEAGAKITNLKLDDFGLFGVDAEGRMVGVAQGEFERRDDGVFAVVLDRRFEPFPSPEPAVGAEAGAATKDVKPGGRTTPSETWETLRAAVAARDLDAYAACFAPERRARRQELSCFTEPGPFLPGLRQELGWFTEPGRFLPVLRQELGRFTEPGRFLPGRPPKATD